MDERCQATRQDGQPCQAKAGPDGLCLWHDPARAAARQAARSAGGRGKSRAARADKLLPASLRPIVGKLIAALDETHAGTLDPRQASAMASLAGALVRVFEVSALEERLRALEEAHERIG